MGGRFLIKNVLIRSFLILVLRVYAPGRIPGRALATTVPRATGAPRPAVRGFDAL